MGQHIDLAHGGHQDLMRFHEGKRRLAMLGAGLMPAMLTRDERVVRQDCLGYLMRRVEAEP